jgi:hypothetical protein
VCAVVADQELVELYVLILVTLLVCVATAARLYARRADPDLAALEQKRARQRRWMRKELVELERSLRRDGWDDSRIAALKRDVFQN